MTRFAIAAISGGLLSLSISFGLIPLVLAVIAAGASALVWRSSAALSGALVGWGTTWVALIGSNYVRCVSMGSDCGGSDSIAVWLTLGAMILGAGVVVGFGAVLHGQVRQPPAPPQP